MSRRVIPARRSRILAVDDDAMMRDSYQEALSMIPASYLQEEEFALTLAKDGTDAVEAVKEAEHDHDPFAVIFLDLKMPPLPDGGIWAAEKIRDIDSLVTMVLVTGWLDIDPLDISRRIPPLDKFLYVQKPYSIPEIQQLAISLGAKWWAEKLLIETNEELYLTNRQLLDTNSSLSILAGNLDTTRRATEGQALEHLRTVLRPLIARLSNDPNLQQYEAEFRELMKHIEDGSSGTFSDMTEADSLTTTEIMITSMVRKGTSNKDIGRMLNMSVDTVKTHRRNIQRKLKIQHAHISLQAYLHHAGEEE